MRALAHWCGRTFAVIALLLAATGAIAHEMSLAEMTVREVRPGQFVWAWGVPAKSRPIAEDLRPIWPEGCEADTATVRCPASGMVGTLAIDGVGQAYSAAIVRIVWRGGDSRVYTITQRQPSVRLFGKAQDDRGWWELAQTYTVLGVEHILGGIDHLLFVLGLVLLVGFRRQLITTITSFTVAHSLTLAASALGALSLRAPPVEIVIALSIALVSAEALSRRETLTRRWPAIVAFVFGLAHGLGFAGALKDIGLPAHNVSVALLGFNVGVEVGQLLVIALAFGVSLAARRLAVPPLARQALLYVIGTMAVFWTLSRAGALLA